MPLLQSILEVDRCPHCQVDRPLLTRAWQFTTHTHSGGRQRVWGAYVCSRCGGVTIAAATSENSDVIEMYPDAQRADVALPPVARSYLDQAIRSRHAPAGAVMLTASAVDAMLKAKGYKDGSLYSRIKRAAADHVITADMETWAHQVRLDANDPRHADEERPLPDDDDARRCVEFAKALGDFLFVLPARVTRGLQDAAQKDDTKPA